MTLRFGAYLDALDALEKARPPKGAVPLFAAPPPSGPAGEGPHPGSRGGQGHVRVITRGPREGQMAFMYGDDPRPGPAPAPEAPPAAPPRSDADQASDPSTSHEELDRLSHHADETIARRALANPAFPPHLLHAHAASADAVTRQYVAEHPQTLPHTLETLAGDEDEYVRLAVAKHAGTPDAIKRRLAADTSADVRAAAAPPEESAPDVRATAAPLEEPAGLATDEEPEAGRPMTKQAVRLRHRLDDLQRSLARATAAGKQAGINTWRMHLAATQDYYRFVTGDAYAGHAGAADAIEQGREEPWTLLEPDYLAYAHEEQVRLTVSNARSFLAVMETAVPTSAAYKEAASPTGAPFWLERANAMLKRPPSERETLTYRQAYTKLVKEAISKGKAVPPAVIAQHSEFETARDGRARYDKGRHTSFGNVSVALDRSMEDERGYKIKRQDGKAMTDAQRDEIASGMSDIEEVLGPLADILRAGSLTIAHTSGKHPFMQGNASGIYSPGDKTMAVGLSDLSGSPIHALAHELGHWLDAVAGDKMGFSVRLFSNSFKPRGSATYASHADDRSATSTPGQVLLRMAERSMTDTLRVHRLLRAKPDDARPVADENTIMRAKFVLGPYWREPHEIFARLMEQYIAEELGRRSVGVEDAAHYQDTPGWWSKDAFARMKPLVKAEIERRIAVLHVQAATEPTVKSFGAYRRSRGA